MKSENVLLDKSFEFSLSIVDFAGKLKKDHHFEIASQVLRSGTSIGANIVEAQRAESKKDFIHKLKISLKEADETKYWLKIIDCTIEKVDEKLKEENEQLIKLLVSIINTARRNLQKS